MKQFIWMLCGIFLTGLLLGALSGCGADQFGVTVITTGRPSDEAGMGPVPEETADPDPAPEREAERAPAPQGGTGPDAAPAEADGGEAALPASAPKGGSAVPDGDAARRLAYAKVLEDALSKGVLPDGTELDYMDQEVAENNDFALADVDGDGEEELLLFWTDAGIAGMRGIVFGYRDGAVYEELSEFPDLTFYANGAAEAGWSHNQGLGGRFWPYNLYRYDADSGVYELAGAADAWDLSLRDTDYAGDPFPRDLDVDGDGLVYYLLPDWWAGQYSAASVVDGAAHEAWRDSYIGGAEIVQISPQALTAENIADLGYWSIPGPAQEPVG